MSMCCFWRLMSLMSQQERLPYFDPSREEVEKLVEACKANDGLSMGLPWFSLNLNGHAAFEFSVQDGLGGLRLAHLPKLSGWVTSGQFGCRIWLLSFLMMLFVLSVVVPSGFSRVFLRCYWAFWHWQRWRLVARHWAISCTSPCSAWSYHPWTSLAISSKKSPKCKVRLGPGDGDKKLNSALESPESQNWSFFEPSPSVNPEASRNWCCRGRHLEFSSLGWIEGSRCSGFRRIHALFLPVFWSRPLCSLRVSSALHAENALLEVVRRCEKLRTQGQSNQWSKVRAAHGHSWKLIPFLWNRQATHRKLDLYDMHAAVTDRLCLALMHRTLDC